MIRVFLIDPHTLVRTGVRHIIGTAGDLNVVGSAENCVSAFALIASERPHLVILSMCYELGEFIDDMLTIKSASPETHILCLTQSVDQNIHESAIRAGARGVVLTYETDVILLKAIHKICDGEIWANRSLGTKLWIAGGSPERDSAEFRISQLTPREVKITELIVHGSTNQRIADELCVAEKTVRNQLTIIFSKLGLSNRLELAAYAAEHGLKKR